MLGQITGNARRYFIKSFSSNDAGKYKCKATDLSGRVDARSTTVTMEGRDKIKHIQNNPYYHAEKIGVIEL